MLGNRFLDALPTESADAIARIANLRVYSEATRLSVAGEAIGEICFPISGAIAHVERDGERRDVEIFALGNEGVSNFEAMLGVEHALFSRVARVPVSAFVLDLRQFATLAQEPALRRLAERYTVAMVRVAALSAACRRHDQIDARLAAWLLRLHDYAGSDQFAVTHERTAAMLGARRASVTAAYQRLAQSGAVRVARRYVELLDRSRLAAMTCSCFDEARSTVSAVYETVGANDAAIDERRRSG